MLNNQGYREAFEITEEDERLVDDIMQEVTTFAQKRETTQADIVMMINDRLAGISLDDEDYRCRIASIIICTLLTSSLVLMNKLYSMQAAAGIAN